MIDIVLLVLKIGVLVLLYLFIWYVVKRRGRQRAHAGRGAVAAAPDIALPDGSRPMAVVTPEERDARRETRLSERTIAGEHLDLTGNIDPRLIVESSPIVPPGVMFPLQGWVTVGRAATSDIVLDENFVSSTHARFVPRGAVLLRRGPRQHQRHVRQREAGHRGAAQVREPRAHRRDGLPLRGVSAPVPLVARSRCAHRHRPAPQDQRGRLRGGPAPVRRLRRHGRGAGRRGGQLAGGRDAGRRRGRRPAAAGGRRGGQRGRVRARRRGRGPPGMGTTLTAVVLEGATWVTSCTSATAAPTCCARASSSSSATTTRWSAR